MAGTFKIKLFEKSLAMECEDLDELATRLCGYGYYDENGVPVKVIRKYLEIGSMWRSTAIDF